MTQQTLTRLRHLKLTGMADAVQQQLEQASTYEGLPFIERLSLLVEHEQLSREQRKQARLVKQARLKLQATVQEVKPPPAPASGSTAPGPEPAHYRPLWLRKNLPSLCAGLPSLSAGAQHSLLPAAASAT